MTDTERNRTGTRIALTSELVAAYVSKNAVRVADLPGLIAALGATLDRISQGRPGDPAQRDPHEPGGIRTAVGPAEIKRSMTPEALVSFLDGKPYKTLKRHLAKHGLTPEGYRARFGLPADYPMVSRNYSERRVAIARSIGLGQASGRSRKAPH